MIDTAAVIAQEAGLDLKESDLLNIVASSCHIVPTPRGDAFRTQDVAGFIKNFVQAIRHRDSSYLRQLRGPCVERVVSVEEFVNSSDYMNQGSNCRPAVMAGLVELFDSPRTDGYIECVLTGSIGWGKTFFSHLAIAYMIYRLSCLHNPQLEYDLAPGTSIVFIQQSKRYELSKKVLFGDFVEMLKLSPYFTKVFPFDPMVKSELRFRKGIYLLPVGGSDTAAIGMNVFGGIIDEMNFMMRVRQSDRFEGVAADDRDYDQAERTYTTLIRRMKSRFMQKGRLPGKLLLVSSANYPGDFTSRKIDESKQDKSILAIQHAQWEVLEADRFSGEKFFVELGDDQKQSRILTARDQAVDVDDVIEVPVEYRSDFERDLPAALRDYAGYTTASAHPFIPYRELIVKAQETYKEMHSGRTLFRRGDVVINQLVDPDAPDWGVLVDVGYIHECVADPGMPFTCHVDVGVSEDAVGVAVARIYGYKLLPSTKYYDPATKEFVEVRDIHAPIYMVDGVLRISPPPSGQQIDLALVRDLVLFLRQYLYLKWATMDSYQSTMMIQAFRRAKMRSGVLSVDQTMAPYTELKLAVKDERILLPPHPLLAREMREVEKLKNKDRVDHPEGGSKDLSDAVAGSIFMLQSKEADYKSKGGRRHFQTQALAPPETPLTEPEPLERVRRLMVGRGRTRLRWR